MYGICRDSLTESISNQMPLQQCIKTCRSFQERYKDIEKKVFEDSRHHVEDHESRKRRRIQPPWIQGLMRCNREFDAFLTELDEQSKSASFRDWQSPETMDMSSDVEDVSPCPVQKPHRSEDKMVTVNITIEPVYDEKKKPSGTEDGLDIK